MYSAPSETRLTDRSPTVSPTPTHNRLYNESESEDSRSRAVQSLGSRNDDSTHSVLSHNVSNNEVPL